MIKQPKALKPDTAVTPQTAVPEKKKVVVKHKVMLKPGASAPVQAVKPVVKPVAPAPETQTLKPAPETQAPAQVAPAPAAAPATAPKAPAASAPVEKVTVKPTPAPAKPAAKVSPAAKSDPLRHGPVIIKNTNLPPIDSRQATRVPSTGGPRQAGVVGGRDFSGTRNTYGRTSDRFGTGQRTGGFGRPGSPAGRAPGQGGFQRPNGFAGGPRPGFGNKKPGTGFGQGGFRKPGAGAPMPSDKPAIGKTKRDYSKRKDSQENWENRRDDREGGFQYRRKESQTALNAVPKSIDILENITVNDLAKKMNLKASEIIAKCFQQGMMLTINQQIDSDTASLIAADYGCEVHIVNLYDETVIPTEETTEEDLVPRAPIVTVMGHVDHGKTKLLDAIRSTKVAEGEFGGITQHIGAYKVSIPDRGDVVFLDTPGHAAFTMMRARGAQITDIVVLVVAANDGVMPQTVEAIDHAKAAKVPIIVAINKCDLPDANPERVMQQLTAYDLTPEEWGGETLYCRISALKRQGIDELLETILIEAEMLDLKAVKDCRAEAKVLESRIDPGRGSVATVIIKKGTLHEGDYYVAGVYPGRVRAMFDDRGNRIKEAGPSTPVEISGLSGLPNAGDPFQVTEDEKQARLVGNKRQELERLGQAKKYKKVTLDNLYEKIKQGEMQELNVIIKGDVQGSVEALQKALEELSNDEIRLSVIRASAGAIIENDITLASASENHALVIGFNVRPTPKAQQLAEQEKIDIRKYNVIYDAVDDIKAAMEGMMAPEKTEVDVGTAEIRQVFIVPKVGPVAGCMVTSGSVKRNNFCRVIRDSIQLNKELVKISSLKRFKDDVKEVASGYECGIGIDGFDRIEVGDILEFVEIKEVKRSLEDAKGAKPTETKK